MNKLNKEILYIKYLADDLSLNYTKEGIQGDLTKKLQEIKDTICNLNLEIE